MKDIIRQEILQKRKNLSRRDKTKFDLQINTGLEDLLRLINPKKILTPVIKSG
jgi:5-formyltetrahydrofolate cyclo-ligase